MSFEGTSCYGTMPGEVPDLVARAVAEAVSLGFPFCVHPAIGGLLGVLAGGVSAGGLVGEIGTGTGAGLAWMVTANPEAQYISVERDTDRARAARRVFADHPCVEIVTGDAGDLFARGPFDLLVHDGGWGSGKTDPRRVDPTVVLRDNGLMTIDDFTPMTVWPPQHNAVVDQSRIDWLENRQLFTTEISVTPDLSVLVCRRRPPSARRA